MKVFVFESICGGGWPKGNLRQSLAAEGSAMLHALCEDLSRLPEVHVTTTLDSRCPLDLPSNLDVVPIDSAAAGQEELHHQAAISDFTFVIAPELENMLTRRVRELRAAGATVIAPRDNVLELCSDKLPLAGFLLNNNIPSIPTVALCRDEFPNLTTEQAVIKPRFGAGSQTISVVPTRDVEKLRQSSRTPPFEQLIVQPFHAGQALSVGLAANAAGEAAVFPVAQQLLSDEGYLQYLGGVVPWTGPVVKQVQDIVRRCYELLFRPEGYVGFDFVVPDANPDKPLLVEINPRLCTSYLGYRQLTDDNLAARMLPGGPTGEINWKDQLVRFQPDGAFQVTPLPEDQTCV